MDRTRSTDRVPRTARTSRTAPRRTATGRGAPSAAPTAPPAATATLEREVPGAPRTDSESAAPAEAPTRARRGRTTGPRSGQRARAPRHRMLLVCTAVLAAGLFGVLLLNTIISQGAFRQHELEIDLILLAEKEEALARSVQAAEAPLEVERRARALGMVPAAAPVFLRLSDGTLLGEPVPAPAPTGPIDFTDAPGLQPTPAPSASASEPATPGIDPATGIDPALDPMTGLTPTPAPAAAPTVAAAPTPAAEAVPTQEPTPTPTPTPTTEGANP